jgi:diguanylate cyclase (GGDEF)-like protein
MAFSKRSARYGALMFLDLDGFKTLNDTHGHAVGDRLLIQVAQRISLCVREADTVARFGGDEFVVMLGDLDEDRNESAAEAWQVAEKIRSALAAPHALSGRQDEMIEHRCTASIGVVLFVDHEAPLDDILKRADEAMYRAKDAGRNRVFFVD